MPSPSRLAIGKILALSVIGLTAFTTGCQGVDTGRASRTEVTAAALAAPETALAPDATTAAAPSATAKSMPMFQMPAAGEQSLDTNVGPDPKAPGGAQVVKKSKHKVRTVSDEHLPKWVPVRGRLTVVDSADLAENLGLVPKGTTQKTDERISVADKLEEERAARTAARGADPMTQGSSWSYAKAGRFRSRR